MPQFNKRPIFSLLILEFALKGIYLEFFDFNHTDQIIIGIYLSPYSPNSKKILTCLLKYQKKIISAKYKYISVERQISLERNIGNDPILDGFLSEKLPKFPINHYIIRFSDEDDLLDFMLTVNGKNDRLEDINNPEEIASLFLTQKQQKALVDKEVRESKSEQHQEVSEDKIINLFTEKRKPKKSSKVVSIQNDRENIDESNIQSINIENKKDKKLDDIETKLEQLRLSGSLPLKPAALTQEGSSGDGNWREVERKEQEQIPDFTFMTNIPTRLIEKDGQIMFDYHNSLACPENFSPLTHMQGLLILIVGHKKLTDAQKFKRLLNCLYLRYRDHNEHRDKDSEEGKEHLRYIKEVASVFFIFCQKLQLTPRGNEQTKLNWFFEQIQSIPFMGTLKRDIERYNSIDLSQRGLLDNQIAKAKREFASLKNSDFDLPIFNTKLRGVEQNRLQDVMEELYKRGANKTSISSDINELIKNIYKKFDSKRGKKRKDSPRRLKKQLKKNRLRNK